MCYKEIKQGGHLEAYIIDKILKVINKKETMEETDACYLMVTFRKILDGMEPSDQQQFLVLRLFCNWVVHIEITNSTTGLRILSAINNALVKYKSASIDEFQVGISNEIGFIALRRELKDFFKKLEIIDTLVSDDRVWGKFVSHLVEIILNIPLTFPELSKLDKAKQKIYKKIAQNSIKPGAGVVLIQISNIDYGNGKIFLCLVIMTEDTSKIIVPIAFSGLG